MKIELIRTGGIIPITKKAEQEVDWSDEDVREIINHIKAESDSPGSMRDSTSYHLNYNAGSFPIDIEKVPAKYKETFEELKNNLKITKPG